MRLSTKHWLLNEIANFVPCFSGKQQEGIPGSHGVQSTLETRHERAELTYASLVEIFL